MVDKWKKKNVSFSWSHLIHSYRKCREVLFFYLTTFYDTHTLGRTPLDDGSARRRPLFDNTQHSQETDIHAPNLLITRNPSKRDASERAATGIENNRNTKICMWNVGEMRHSSHWYLPSPVNNMEVFRTPVSRCPYQPPHAFSEFLSWSWVERSSAWESFLMSTSHLETEVKFLLVLKASLTDGSQSRHATYLKQNGNKLFN